MSMEKVFKVIAVLLAIVAVFIFFYPQLSEKKKVNDRCAKAREAKAQKAQEKKDSVVEDAQIVNDSVEQCVITSES